MQQFTVHGWVGTRAKITLNDGTTYYAMIVSVREGCAFLSDVTSYSLDHSGNEPTYKWAMRKHGKLAVPSTSIRQFSSAGEEPVDGDNTGLPNPFFKPIIDPPPTFRFIPWWKDWVSFFRALHF